MTLEAVDLCLVMVSLGRGGEAAEEAAGTAARRHGTAVLPRGVRFPSERDSSTVTLAPGP